ncbi:MAG: efflux RND transporter periplasmic adaptor subunit [bacterium]|nr:efflux RND transporter periplasmic adaptor subunit [bacterium]
MKVKQIVVGILILAVGFAGGVWLGGEEEMPTAEAGTYRCPMHPTVVSEKPGSCPICGMDFVKDRAEEEAHAHGGSTSSGERKILYWRAPMDPNFISETPGQSPMGMDLIPVYEDEVMGAGGGVKIDPIMVQNIGVKTAIVEHRPLSRTVRTVGRVDYDETRITDVNTKVMGWVEKLFVNYTGQEVKKGQPLLEIYSPELVAAQEEYLTALEYVQRLEKSASKEIITGARDLLNSSKQRLFYWDITGQQIAELERTRKVKRTMTLHSPQEGIVIHKAVYNGSHIKAGQHLYRIADLDRVWIYADIYEYEIPWIKVGQEAEVELSYAPGKVRRGKVTFIYPFLDSKTRTAKVRMAFPNPELALKPEMYANVKIKPVVSRHAVVVPTQSVIHSGERNVVILDMGNGRFLPRELVLGVEAEGVYEVIEGLKGGEKIVISAQFLIDSESNLKAALAGMVEKPSGDQEEASGDQQHPEAEQERASFTGHPPE